MMADSEHLPRARTGFRLAHGLPVAAGLVWLAAAVSTCADTVNIASTNGSAAVAIVAPLTVAQTSGLNFGAITSGAAGVVAISPADGSRSVTGGVGAVAANAGAAGAFLVTGRPNAAVNVVVGSKIVGMPGIDGWTTVTSLPTALVGPTAAFTVGGTLNVAANTPPGLYTGTYTVTVNYP